VTIENTTHPGAVLRDLLKCERPLQIAGTINAYAALLAQRAGFQAIYLSGAGVANASFGIPDLGYTRVEDVAEDARRIGQACSLPLLVDADTGWDSPAATVRTLEGVGVAGIHLEDQVSQKRCGHRPGKKLVATESMVARLAEAVQARRSDQFVIMARTDAHTVEGLDAAIARARQYVAAGCRHDFCRGAYGPARISALLRGSGRTGAGQRHRVWKNSVVFPRRIGGLRRRNGAISVIRVPRHERRRAAYL